MGANAPGPKHAAIATIALSDVSGVLRVDHHLADVRGVFRFVG